MMTPYLPIWSPLTERNCKPIYNRSLIPQILPYDNTGWSLQALHPLYPEWHRSPQPPHAGGPERMEERPPHTAHIDWAGMFPGEIILHGPNRKEVALTFDDGPDDEWTPMVLCRATDSNKSRSVPSNRFGRTFYRQSFVESSQLHENTNLSSKRPN